MPLYFTCVLFRTLKSKSMHFHSFNSFSFIRHATLSHPRFKMQQDVQILKQKCNSAMIALWSVQVWWSWVHASLRKLCQYWPTPNIALENAKSSITQPWIIRFGSNFVQSLNAWHPKCFKSSRSVDQRSRSRRQACINVCKNSQNYQ